MSRSRRVLPRYIEQVKCAVQRSGFARQRDLAEELQLCLSTVNSFLNGKSVDFLNFLELCRKLGLEWEEVADFGDHNGDSGTEIDPKLPEIQIENKLPYYIERPPVESLCITNVQKPGSLLRIKAPRRMGKTSLITQVLARVLDDRDRVVSFSLLLADEAFFSDLDFFLKWFCAVVSYQLKLPNKLQEHWENDCGSNFSCTMYFEEYLLSQIDSPLVLVIDDVDRIFSASFAKDFLAMLRAWYDKAQSDPLWQKLRLIISHSTEDYVRLNINQSPFNVGEPIELPEFSAEQVQDLARQQGISWNAAKVQQIMDCVGGHPSLVQRAIHCLKNQTVSFEQLLKTAPTEAGIYSSHLLGHLDNFRQHPELTEAMKQVIESTRPVQLESTQSFKLKSLGLVISEEGNAVIPRCYLYTTYFRECL
jgi:DNA-binding Xre family transcriptional regulator